MNKKIWTPYKIWKETEWFTEMDEKVRYCAICGCELFEDELGDVCIDCQAMIHTGS